MPADVMLGIHVLARGYVTVTDRVLIATITHMSLY